MPRKTHPPPPPRISQHAKSFNEAAAVMPRKTSTRLYCPDVPASRFNEAAAVMPRKTLPYAPPHAPPRCFNEAAAVMPRKTLEEERRKTEDLRASMRPRQ